MSANDSAMTPGNAAKQASDAGFASPSSPSLTDLPAPLRDTIAAVCKRARLWKHERADVEAELAAHFHDGLAQGTAPDQLLADFGDVRAAAKLIRRGKIRNRPLWWQVQRRIGQAIAAMLLLLVAFIAVHTIRFYTGSPTISFRPVDELNRDARALAESDRAWPLYRRAVLDLNMTASEFDLLGTVSLGDTDAIARIEPILARNAASLALINAAAAKPGLGIIVGIQPDAELDAISSKLLGTPPVTPGASPAPGFENQDPENPDAFMILLPHLQHLRAASRLLRDDAVVAVARGDAKRAHTNLLSIISIAKQNRSPDTLISCLVSVAITKIAANLTMDILAADPKLFTEDQLIQLAHQFASLGGPRDFISLKGERIGFRDAMQRLYTDDGSGDGRLTAAGAAYLQRLMTVSQTRGSTLAVAITSPLVAGRLEMTRAYETLFARAEEGLATPLFTPIESSTDRALQSLTSGGLSSVRFLPISVLFPALDRARVTAYEAVSNRDATLVAIAAECFRRAHGSFPASLESLKPGLIPEIPVDPVDGKPLRYRPSGDSYVLYSIGSDGNDDGGTRPATDEDSNAIRRLDSRAKPKAPCDLIYFPRVAASTSERTAGGPD